MKLYQIKTTMIVEKDFEFTALDEDEARQIARYLSRGGQFLSCGPMYCFGEETDDDAKLGNIIMRDVGNKQMVPLEIWKGAGSKWPR